MTKIATVTVGSGGAASIELTSIPGTFTDLMVVFSCRNNQAAVSSGFQLSFNGVTTNRSFRFLVGDGSSATSGSGSDGYIGNIPGTTSTANTFGNISVYIPNYASANNKSFSVDNVSENNATTASAFIFAGLWSQTAAITSIGFYNPSQTILQYSTATLYGITKGTLAGVTVS